MVQNSLLEGKLITIPELGQYNKGHDWLRSLCFNVSVRDGMVLQWNGLIRITLSYMNNLQVLQNKAAKLVLDKPLYSSATDALNQLGWLNINLKQHRHFYR